MCRRSYGTTPIKRATGMCNNVLSGLAAEGLPDGDTLKEPGCREFLCTAPLPVHCTPDDSLRNRMHAAGLSLADHPPDFVCWGLAQQLGSSNSHVALQKHDCGCLPWLQSPTQALSQGCSPNPSFGAGLHCASGRPAIAVRRKNWDRATGRALMPSKSEVLSVTFQDTCSLSAGQPEPPHPYCKAKRHAMGAS